MSYAERRVREKTHGEKIREKPIYRLSELPEIKSRTEMIDLMTGKEMIWVFKYISLQELRYKQPSYLRTERKD